MEAISSRLEAIAFRVEAIAIRLEAIASRLEAVAIIARLVLPGVVDSPDYWRSTFGF